MKTAFLPKYFAALVLLLLALQPASVLAHGGGTAQLVKEPAGAYAVYVWTNPDPVRVGTMHVTVALVEPDSDEPIMNAAVQITATPQTGQPLVAEATHKNATVKSYYEVDMELTETGPLQVAVAYQDGDAAGSAGFTVQVERAGMNTAAIGLGAALLAIGGGVIWMLLGRKKRPAAGEQ
ncbi:MAG: hypothetical protein KDI07_05385 [Anaerolineae bacterium]|nr:hypothetical protein [Anaerolineae bacterium]MCB9131106.1 hypothetical protein [Anaerolineales bacterium]MCB0227856.1 hypothetical protein [Anaerolineae bacterium]MCB0233409.1 hypothetical protein [Anaerolineae bacterium]MCB0237696.1 hypothetical protein [Anaerolineae bacterium]